MKAPVGVRSTWHQRASCRARGLGLFFAPDYSETREQRLTREASAKKVCASCRVRDTCLAYAIDANERYGIWGGMTEDERKRYRRRIDRPASGA